MDPGTSGLCLAAIHIHPQIPLSCSVGSDEAVMEDPQKRVIHDSAASQDSVVRELCNSSSQVGGGVGILWPLLRGQGTRTFIYQNWLNLMHRL